MRTVVLALNVSLAIAVGGFGATGQSAKNARGEATTITGVITQHDADYVIADSEDVKPIAVLEGVGFPKESFARFVGMPVRVRGTLVTEKDRKVLRVRSLSDVQQTPPPKQ